MLLAETPDYIAVNKPPGVLTQAPRGVPSVEVFLREMLRTRDGRADPYVGVVHRLDRPASGVLLFAKTPTMAANLGRQFAERRVAKTYWIFVCGRVAPVEGTWSDHMRKIPGRAAAELVPAEHPDAKHAVLRYRVLESIGRGSWLEVELETGRTHQIRLQASSRGHAVHGDAQYGNPESFGGQFADARNRPIALHARRLEFTAADDTSQALVAEIPAAWQGLGLELSLFS